MMSQIKKINILQNKKQKNNKKRNNNIKMKIKMMRMIKKKIKIFLKWQNNKKLRLNNK